MAVPRVDFDRLLRDRRLGGLTPSWTLDPRETVSTAPTGIAALDERLGGGLPRGHLSEFVGPQGSGRTGLLHAALAAATTRGEVVAVVDTLDRFDPETAAEAGVDLSRLLWVRGLPTGAVPAAGRGRDSVLDPALDRAVKAMMLVAQAGGFGTIALDLADVPWRLVRGLPFTTWMRIARVLEGTDTVGIVLGPQPLARSAGGVTLTLNRANDGVRWSGRSARARRFAGLAVHVRIGRARFRRGDDEPIPLVVVRREMPMRDWWTWAPDGPEETEPSLGARAGSG